MPKTNKYLYVWNFYVKYGEAHGWEHEHTELTREAMVENKRVYQENCPYPLKITRARVPNPDLNSPGTS